MTMIGISMPHNPHGTLRKRCVGGVSEVWKMMGWYVLIILLGMVSACTTIIPPPVPLLENRAVAPEEAWARVLRQAVDEEGRVNFALVAKNQNDLNIYMAYVSKVSPRSHPDLFPSRRLLDE